MFTFLLLDLCCAASCKSSQLDDIIICIDTICMGRSPGCLGHETMGAYIIYNMPRLSVSLKSHAIFRHHVYSDAVLSDAQVSNIMCCTISQRLMTSFLVLPIFSTVIL